MPIVDERLRAGWRVGAVADAMGIDPSTVRKWRERFAREGESGLAGSFVAARRELWRAAQLFIDPHSLVFLSLPVSGVAES